MSKISKIASAKLAVFRPGVPVEGDDGNFVGYVKCLADIQDNNVVVMVEGCYADGEQDEIAFDTRDLSVIQ